MDNFHFKHIGQGQTNASFSFPNKRSSATVPSLLSRMSEKEGTSNAYDDAADMDPRLSESPKPTRSLHDRIVPLHPVPSLSDRIDPSPSKPLLASRISIPDPSPALADRISAAGPSVAQTPLKSQVSPLDSPPRPTRKVSPPESQHGPLASRLTTVDANAGDAKAAPTREIAHEVHPRRLDAPATTVAPQVALDLAQPSASEPLTTAHAQAPITSSKPSSALPTHNPNPRPQAHPSVAPIAPVVATTRPLFPPSSNVLPSPSKTDPPFSTLTKPNTIASGTLALYLTQVWAESEAQMREWGEVANERARERSLSAQPQPQPQPDAGQPKNVGKKRARDDDVAGQLDKEDRTVVEPTPKRIKISTRESGSAAVPEHVQNDRREPSRAPSPSSISHSKPGLEPEPDSTARKVEREPERASPVVDVLSVPKCPAEDGVVGATPAHVVRPSGELEHTTRRADDKVIPQADQPQPEEDDPDTPQEDTHAMALLAAAAEERQRKELEEAAALRKKNLEQELAFLAREEAARVRREKMQKQKEERAEKALKAEKEKADRELKEREQKLREEVQRRKLEKAAQAPVELATLTRILPPPPPPSAPPASASAFVTSQNTSTIPAPIIPVQRPASIPAPTTTRSPISPTQSLQRPLPPKSSLFSSRLGPDPSEPAIPLAASKSSSGSSASVARRPIIEPSAPIPPTTNTISDAAAAPLLLTHPLINNTPASVPSPLALTTSPQVPPTLKSAVIVKQEATEPQLTLGGPSLIPHAAQANAISAHGQTTPMLGHESGPTSPSINVSPTSNRRSSDTALPPSGASSMTRFDAPAIEHRPPKIVLSRDVTPSLPSATTPLTSNAPLIKREPKSENDSELLSAPSTSRMSKRSPSMGAPTNPPSKRPRSPSLAATTNPIVKKRRDSSPEMELELTYPDATSETSGWGHVDLDQEEEERRPGGRQRRPRTRTPEDASGAFERLGRREASPDLARTPPRPTGWPTRSRSRSRSRSPVRAGRGRGRPPRGPRGRGNGRNVGEQRPINRYEPGPSLLPPRSRSPPPISRSRSPVGPTYNRRSPPPPGMQGRLSPLPRSAPFPFSRSHVPGGEREGRWQPDAYRPHSPPGPPPYYDTRRGADVPDRHLPVVRSRTPPREPNHLPDRRMPPVEPSYARQPNPNPPRRDGPPVDQYSRPRENRSIPPHIPTVPHDYASASVPSASSHSSRNSSFTRGRGIARTMHHRPPILEKDGARPSSGYQPYTTAGRRTVSASSVQHLAHNTESTQSTAHSRPLPSKHTYQAPLPPSAPAIPSLMNRMQAQRSVTGPSAPQVPNDYSGVSHVAPKRGGGYNQRARGGGGPGIGRGSASRAKLASRITDAPAGGSLIGRVNLEGSSG